MDATHEPGGAELALLARMGQVTSRRTFLKWSGVTLGVAAVGCSSDTTGAGDTVSLGTGDTAILNYAYVLEQLEAAYYTQVVKKFYPSITDEEKQILTDIRDHEIAHRDFLKTALGSSAAPELEFDFSAIDFASRKDVLAFAAAFEDSGVAAYNGAGALLTGHDNLLVAGSIVSVEARHAAVIRDLIAPRTAATGFAGDDAVDPATGLDRASAPSVVLASVSTYVTATIDASNLP